MRTFVETLRRTLEADPRPLVLAYQNPAHAAVLEGCGFMDRTAVIETLLLGTCYVYRATGLE